MSACSLCAHESDHPRAFTIANFLACTRNYTTGTVEGALVVCRDRDACQARRGEPAPALTVVPSAPRPPHGARVVSEQERYEAALRGETV